MEASLVWKEFYTNISGVNLQQRLQSVSFHTSLFYKNNRTDFCCQRVGCFLFSFSFGVVNLKHTKKGGKPYLIGNSMPDTL